MSLDIEVFDKAGNFKGRVGVYRSASILDTFNGKASSSFQLDSRHPRSADLREPGAMVRFVAPGIDQTGTVNTFTTAGPRRATLTDFTVDSHFMMFEDVLGWVHPNRPINEQGVAGSNAIYTGTEESIVKAVMAANGRDRLGWPLTIPANANRGQAGMTVKFRFHPLFDKLFPVTDGAGLSESTLRWTIIFNPSTKRFVVDCAPVRTLPRTLTESSGLAEWSVTSARPTATDVVIGGAGEAEMRDFRVITDAPRIAEWGHRRERFRDARDADGGDSTTLYKRGQETLDEGRPKAGIRVTLTETAARRYGTAMRVGDRVNLELGDGQNFGPEILREVRINYTREKGREVTPSIGELADSPDSRVVKAVQRIARSIRREVV